MKICPLCGVASDCPEKPFPPGYYEAPSEVCSTCAQASEKGTPTMKIFKYTLPIEYSNGLAGWSSSAKISIPKGAKILSSGVQGRIGVVWALVDPLATPERRELLIVSTGGDLPAGIESRRFIGTLSFDGGAIVLHLFE